MGRWLQGWIQYAGTEVEGQAERLARLAQAQRRLSALELGAVCAVIGIAMAAAHLQMPAAEAWRYVPQNQPVLMGMAAAGALSAASGRFGAARLSVRATRLHFLLNVFLLYHLEAFIYLRVDEEQTMARECDPQVANYGDLAKCGDRAPSTRVLLGCVLLLVLVTLAASTVALDFDDALTDIRTTPLEETHLARILKWCDSDGDGLISLSEFVRYHSVVKLLESGRERLLRENFARCDPRGSGVLPLKIFRRVYRLTFMGGEVRGRGAMEAQERIGRTAHVLGAVGALRAAQRRPSQKSGQRWALAAAAGRPPGAAGAALPSQQPAPPLPPPPPDPDPLSAADRYAVPPFQNLQHYQELAAAAGPAPAPQGSPPPSPTATPSPPADTADAPPLADAGQGRPPPPEPPEGAPAEGEGTRQYSSAAVD